MWVVETGTHHRNVPTPSVTPTGVPIPVRKGPAEGDRSRNKDIRRARHPTSRAAGELGTPQRYDAHHEGPSHPPPGGPWRERRNRDGVRLSEPPEVVTSVPDVRGPGPEQGEEATRCDRREPKPGRKTEGNPRHRRSLVDEPKTTSTEGHPRVGRRTRVKERSPTTGRTDPSPPRNIRILPLPHGDGWRFSDVGTQTGTLGTGKWPNDQRKDTPGLKTFRVSTPILLFDTGLSRIGIPTTLKIGYQTGPHGCPTLVPPW